MIDYNKIHGLAVNACKLLNNDRLTFTHSNIATTGEVLNRWQVAHFKGMTFKVKGNVARLEFSPHKYFEGGKTNFRDFHLNNIQDIISEVSTTFEIDPEKSILNFIEIGVNVRLVINPSELIKCIVSYKNSPFDKIKVTGKGYGRECNTQHFVIKVYDKGDQHELDYHLLRFEVKVKKMIFLKRYGINTLTLADLANAEFYPKFTTILLDIFNGILIYNPEITPDNFTNQKDRELFINGRYAEYWQKLERTKRHRQIKRFIELAESGEIKKKLHDLILEKCNELTTCTNHSTPAKLQQNNRFQESVKNEDLQRNNLTINCYNVAHCIVTGLPILNQKPGTKYISAKGVKWYYENEPDTFKNELEIFLPKKWLKKHMGEPMQHYFKKIYHQIRNKDRNPKNNPRNNTKKSYRNIENKGLKLWPISDTISTDKLRLIS